MHGLPYSIAPDTQKHVPMLLWLSEDYQQRYQVSQTCLQKRASSEDFSQDNLFSTLLGLTGVQTQKYQAADDILQPCREAKRMKILIVEDDTLLLQGLILAAQTEGYACDGVSTARAAEQCLETGHYSLVVLDWFTG